MKKWCIALIYCLGVLTIPQALASSEPVLELSWQDLIPEQQREQFNQFGVPEGTSFQAKRNNRPEQPMFGDMREELNGKTIRLSGLIIPLEGDEETMTELLLVPYHGACIHMPPPPPNQIVYIKFEHPVPVRQVWDVVTVQGELSAVSISTDLAEVGYQLNGLAISDYQPASVE